MFFRSCSPSLVHCEGNAPEAGGYAWHTPADPCILCSAGRFAWAKLRGRTLGVGKACAVPSAPPRQTLQYPAPRPDKLCGTQRPAQTNFAVPSSGHPTRPTQAATGVQAAPAMCIFAWPGPGTGNGWVWGMGPAGVPCLPPRFRGIPFTSLAHPARDASLGSKVYTGTPEVLGASAGRDNDHQREFGRGRQDHKFRLGRT